jgi:hypothetical protein
MAESKNVSRRDVIQDNDKPLAVLLKYEGFLAMQEKMPDEE